MSKTRSRATTRTKPRTKAQTKKIEPAVLSLSDSVEQRPITIRQFPLDYAPLRMSLPVERGEVGALVRNANGENDITVYANGIGSGEASISIPLDHATEFAARINDLISRAKIAGLEVG